VTPYDWGVVTGAARRKRVHAMCKFLWRWGLEQIADAELDAEARPES
jgi:hypothetical protein